MADVIDYKIIGDDMQTVEVKLDPLEGVRAEVGTMLYMEDDIQMDTSTGGGILKGFKRLITGDSFFISNFYNTGKKERSVAFAAPFPGKIIPIDLKEYGGAFYCQKDGFLCAAKGIEIEVAFTKKIGAGLFGGEGFILQKLEGDGLTFVHAGGTVIKRELSVNETLRVDTGCLVAFSTELTYDIQLIGGIKNALFGGEGLFLASLQGPGTVYLQSLPFSRLADRIIAASRSMGKGSKEETKRMPGMLGDLISGQ